MRPVKDRWTWPARTPPVSARPPRRDVARAGVEHANTGPAARGCWPRTDGLRGSIRRRDRSSRGSANGDAVPNNLPREGRLAPPDHAPIGNRPRAPAIACRSCAVSDGQNPQAEPGTSGIVHRTHRRRSGWSMVTRKEGDGRGLTRDHPRTVAAQISTAPAIN